MDVEGAALEGANVNELDPLVDFPDPNTPVTTGFDALPEAADAPKGAEAVGADWPKEAAPKGPFTAVAGFSAAVEDPNLKDVEGALSVAGDPDGVGVLVWKANPPVGFGASPVSFTLGGCFEVEERNPKAGLAPVVVEGVEVSVGVEDTPPRPAAPFPNENPLLGGAEAGAVSVVTLALFLPRSSSSSSGPCLCLSAATFVLLLTGALGSSVAFLLPKAKPEDIDEDEEIFLVKSIPDDADDADPVTPKDAVPGLGGSPAD